MTSGRVDSAPPLGQSRASFSIAPISLAGPHRTSLDAALLNGKEAEDESHRITAGTKTSTLNEQKESLVAAYGVVELTVNDHQSGDFEHVSKVTEDDRLTDVEFPEVNRCSSSIEPRQQSTERTRRSHNSADRTLTNPETPLQPVKPSKVVKRTSTLRQHPSSLPSGTSAAPSGRYPSEEDLYYLLLHRYRKREHTEKQLAARLRQLENENTELCLAAREYQQQLESSNTSSSRQAAEIRAQKAIINDIKDSYSKIKDFMKKVCEDQLNLKDKAHSIDREKQRLRDERDSFRHDLEDTKNTTATSSNAMKKIKAKIAECRQNTVLLETSLRNSKLDLQNKQSLLAQEQRRNVRYENHIAEVTRKHDSFSSVIGHEQQRVWSTLQGIRERLGNLETESAQPAQPPNLPAMDQCVEMLKALTKVETATPADITDMIQAVHVLTER